MASDDTYMDKLVAGEVSVEDLDRYVERWHASGGDEVPLHEYLGLTWSEYQRLGAGDGVLDELVDQAAAERRAADDTSHG